MNPRGLIVGASGQVGGALAEVLGAANCIRTYGSHPLDGGLRLDLAEVAEHPALAHDVLARGPFDAVYVAAAMTNVDDCEQRPGDAMRVNRDGPAALARAAAATSARTVLFSTEYVFDGESGPYSEDDPPSPVSVYGQSKLAAEESVLAADPNALVIRTTVVFGPEARGRNFAYRLASELGAGRDLRAPADQVSSPTYCRDLAEATVALVAAGARGIVNVAGPEIMDRAEFARRLARAAGFRPERVVPVTTRDLQQRARRPLQAGLRVTRLRELVPNVRLRTVEEAVAHWTENQRGMPWPTN